MAVFISTFTFLERATYLFNLSFVVRNNAFQYRSNVHVKWCQLIWVTHSVTGSHKSAGVTGMSRNAVGMKIRSTFFDNRSVF